MIKNIHHVGIVVRDFEMMLRFYEDAFGFKVLGTELNIPKEKAAAISGANSKPRNSRVIMMQAGNCYLEIMGNPDAPVAAGAAAAGYVQLCIDVEDIDAEYARLKGIGMQWGPPAPVDFGHVKAVTGCDPEGNVIELVETVRNWDCNLAELLPSKR
jgi:catechol 2,3-dioxygenase-like lactoylglutathione lyase family enzyme